MISTVSTRVWGIGLTRTGTTSLNAALVRLGINAVHWPTLSTLLYDDVEAATDESVAAVFRYLDDRYPCSKFILTTRDRHSWLRSTEAHRERMHEKVTRLLERAPGHVSSAERERWAEIRFTQTTLYDSVEFDPVLFARGYERHESLVSTYFSGRERDLLRLDICGGEGWERLCPFLGKSLPLAPFPRVNSASDKRSSGAPLD